MIKGKKGVDTEYPVEGEKFVGRLSNKNASLDEAFENLEIHECQFRVAEIGKRSFITDKEIEINLTGESFYSKKFYQGATIVPRPLWFVEIKKHERFGVNPRTPYVETSQRAASLAKDQYANVRMRGNIESEFLYFVITGSELVPFAFLPLPIAVLPIQPMKDRYRLITKNEARSRGFSHLARWLEEAEEIWNVIRGEKAEKMDIYERLNRFQGLSRQNPSKKFKVVYNTAGTYIVSSVINLEKLPKTIEIDGAKVKINGLIVDHMCYCFETDNENEAYCLCSFLNAPITDELIKDMQTRGLFGARHIHKKVLELPIPRYNPENEAHERLAEVGKTCEQKSRALLGELMEKYSSIGKIRSEIKIELENELSEISELVLKIFEEKGVSIISPPLY